MDGENRMSEEHSRPGVTYHLLYLLSHLWLVAVDVASCAGGLVFLEGAFFEMRVGVVLEFSAILAEGALWLVVALAVKLDHVGDGFALTCHSWVVVGHGAGVLVFWFL